ncbi:hypothetical protein M0208_06350 [Sphingomonas sp. SUN019]|uniref:hypothetical protein n=1 Tax=Sphingomonas sp. SUN019 TaxID=2937788 RepID=UPI002164762E|nr:hypothetical protein [Sphingomonas sp. SUN019]UVO50157.1 hypothetical protein M0208_06350 [Sphingomonas sp. SUN019]
MAVVRGLAARASPAKARDDRVGKVLREQRRGPRRSPGLVVTSATGTDRLHPKPSSMEVLSERTEQHCSSQEKTSAGNRPQPIGVLLRLARDFHAMSAIAGAQVAMIAAVDDAFCDFVRSCERPRRCSAQKYRFHSDV